MKIGVISGCLDNYRGLSAITIDRNKADYCKRNGYDLILETGVSEPFRNPNSHAQGFSWSRLARMRALAVGGEYDWLYCVGCDTMITNFRFRLEYVIDACGRPRMPRTELPLPPAAPGPVVTKYDPPYYSPDGMAHVIFPSDRGSRVQADSFFVRCDPIGVAYLDDILSHYGIYATHCWVEQQAMIDLRFKHAAITHIVPQHWINSYDYKLVYHLGPEYHQGLDCYGERGQWAPGDFLVHWPGQPLELRLELAKDYQSVVLK